LKAQQDGEAKGRRQGREEGREEGAKEKAIQIARSLLDVLDMQTISQTTGLSVAEVEQLRNSN
jgi:predicted transposase YdaD